MKRLLSILTLLAFAISLVVSSASASPVIDPVEPVPLHVSTTTQLSDGWYSAALQQTLINAAKKRTGKSTWYRSAAPIAGHGPVLP